MADNHATQHTGGHPAMDYAEHEKSYDLFLALTKWGTISTIIVLILMAIVLL